MEAAAGRHIGPGSQGKVAFAVAHLLLGAQLGFGVGIVVAEDAARELKHLQVGQLVVVGVGLVGGQQLADGLEVAVARGEFARAEHTCTGPAGDLVGTRLAAGGRRKLQRAACRQARVRHVAGVGQVHGAGRVVGVEPVVNALVLQQAGQKLEIRLLVLHAVAPGQVGADDLGGVSLLEAADGAVVTHRVQHLQHRLVLQDARIAAFGEQPEPGAQGDVVFKIPPHRRRPHETHGMALAMPFVGAALGVGKTDHHVEGITQDVLRVDAAVAREHGQLIERWPRQRLMPGDAPEHQVRRCGGLALDLDVVVGHGCLSQRRT